jgi:ribosome modulation factor
MTKPKDVDEASMQFVVTVLVDDPITDNVHQPYSAFNQGFDAYELFRMPVELNPYPAGSERDWWEMGWEEAREQNESDGSNDTEPIQEPPSQFGEKPTQVEEGMEVCFG